MSTQNRNFLWVIHDYFYDGVTTSNCHCVEKGRQCSCNRGDYIVSGPQWPLPWSKFVWLFHLLNWMTSKEQPITLHFHTVLSVLQFLHVMQLCTITSLSGRSKDRIRCFGWISPTYVKGCRDNTTWTVLCARFFEVSHVTPKVVHHFGCDTTLAGFLGVTGWNQLQRSCCSRNFLVIVFGGEGCL